jgi:hypothetical protein
MIYHKLCAFASLRLTFFTIYHKLCAFAPLRLTFFTIYHNFAPLR